MPVRLVAMMRSQTPPRSKYGLTRASPVTLIEMPAAATAASRPPSLPPHAVTRGHHRGLVGDVGDELENLDAIFARLPAHGRQLGFADIHQGDGGLLGREGEAPPPGQCRPPRR